VKRIFKQDFLQVLVRALWKMLIEEISSILYILVSRKKSYGERRNFVDTFLLLRNIYIFRLIVLADTEKRIRKGEENYAKKRTLCE